MLCTRAGIKDGFVQISQSTFHKDVPYTAMIELCDLRIMDAKLVCNTFVVR